MVSAARRSRNREIAGKVGGGGAAGGGGAPGAGGGGGGDTPDCEVGQGGGP
ncbi:UNVERIFIED_ORG: hypothetical protein ABIB19_000533, partial [Arthrobacter sp. UYEF10]